MGGVAGPAAAAHGRALLENAIGADELRRWVGRPSIDPHAQPGQASTVRHVRVARRASERVDAIAEAQGRKASAVIRDAIDDYLAAHSA